MSIGGTDVILQAPRNQPLGDVILRACRRHWPACVFQDANEIAVHSLQEPFVWQVGVISKEFFVYRDQCAAERWAAEGASHSNADTMVYFIIADAGIYSMLEVTAVCGQLTLALRQLVDNIEASFQDLLVVPYFQEAA